MRLDRLLDGIAVVAPNKLTVNELSLDSRQVRAGGLFLALPGRQHHGLEFAAEVAARGAAALLWEPAPGVAAPGAAAAALPAFAVPDLRSKLGRIADRFYGAPSAGLRITGITGTNGKTTSAYLLAQGLERLGAVAAYIGTIGWGRIGALAPTTHTTPDVITLHRMLAQLRAAGVTDVAIEVSSQALDQERLAGVRFHAAAFTNLTRDHLDYHGSMQAYGAAKERLFAFPELRHLIVNVGDEFGAALARRIASDAGLTVVWVGAVNPAWAGQRYVRAARSTSAAHAHAHAGAGAPRRGLALEIDGSFGSQPLQSRLVGGFNAENLVVVLGCLVSLGAGLQAAVEALGACAAPPGRLEVVEGTKPGAPLAVIDYAHTPDALAKALRALREPCTGLLWCVFGCGGDRDPGKRPLMGRVADELADRIIVTDDNPRGEAPEAITAAIAAGIQRRSFRVIHDRAQAIAAALTEAGSADVVLIAGKGHEEYQIHGNTSREFSDRREAERILREAA
jgi:UDP-N-acetylmuramoyl-L-alanyl-D-glutamate--2,6-diaminopimelate ligase